MAIPVAIPLGIPTPLLMAIPIDIPLGIPILMATPMAIPLGIPIPMAMAIPLAGIHRDSRALLYPNEIGGHFGFDSLRLIGA